MRQDSFKRITSGGLTFGGITFRLPLVRAKSCCNTERVENFCCLNPVSLEPGNSCRRCHGLHSNHMLNRGYAYTTSISSKYHGQTLLSHLGSLYAHSTPQAWQQKLNSGEVTVNGVRATGSELLTSGQTLVWNRPPWIEPDAPQHFEVLFDDPHLLAVNKPSGLPTLPGGGFMENTLLRLVQKQTPDANPVHRLGRATTGIVLFAKTPQAASTLFANWNTPGIQKIYRALAQGVARQDAYEILTSIGLVPHPRIGSVWAAQPDEIPGTKTSKSLAKVIARTASTTTFEVSLYSGRPHQIRIHLASIGHPLVGDPLYGVTGRPLEHLPGLPGDGGYLLHAQFLKFPHPITGEHIELEAALPPGLSLQQQH
jgi:23S rRNA pseudouridine1911/1915/1917 synthase